MSDLDRLLAAWAKQNAEAIYHNLETKVNPRVDWRKDNIVKVVVDFIGWPSEWERPEPYFEELQHVLNDCSEDFGVPIPAELTAYQLSLWAGRTVPPTHPLVRECERWRDVVLASEYDDADGADMMTLLKLLRGIATGEAAANLGSLEDVEAHYASPTLEGRLFTVNAGDSALFLVVGDESLAAMNQDGQVVALDFEGNRLHAGKDLSRIQNYIVQGLKFSRPITERGELASLVGNNVADMLLGDGEISIFDLPSDDYD